MQMYLNTNTLESILNIVLNTFHDILPTNLKKSISYIETSSLQA